MLSLQPPVEPSEAAEAAKGGFNAGETIIEHVSNTSVNEPIIHLPHIFGIDMSVTKHVLMLWIVSIILFVGVTWLVRRFIRQDRPIPGRTMTLLEIAIEFVRDSIVEPNVGHKWSRAWTPLVLTLFLFIFLGNLMGVIPIFIAMTRDDSLEKKRDMAKRASIAAFFILTTFAVAGTLIFKVFGVTLGAFKVAGGVLLLLTSIEMLRAQQVRTRTSTEEEAEGAQKEDVAIFPLAIPLLAGPGAIATVMAVMGRAGRILFAVPVVLSIAVTCVASYLMLLAADRIQRWMGVTGLNVMNRVIGLIIGAIAVQFMFDGLRDTFPGLSG